jgi:1,4-alpha-glucan branching enzyme
MHDTLDYFAKDPIYRAYHQNMLTFRSLYAFTENFVLPLSHDEVVYGKGSLLGKMPGDPWQRFASLRLLFSYMWAVPGKKLLFMGGEFGQYAEWNHDASLDWSLLERPEHGKLAQLVGTLNHLHRTEPALHQRDAESGGFEWIDGSNAAESILTFLRRGEGDEVVLVCLNFTPAPRVDYRVGVPKSGAWREAFNSDARELGGSGMGNLGRVLSEPVAWNGRRDSIKVTIPPLGAVFFRPDS